MGSVLPNTRNGQKYSRFPEFGISVNWARHKYRYLQCFDCRPFYTLSGRLAQHILIIQQQIYYTATNLSVPTRFAKRLSGQLLTFRLVVLPYGIACGNWSGCFTLQQSSRSCYAGLLTTFWADLGGTLGAAILLSHSFSRSRLAVPQTCYLPRKQKKTI